MPTKRYQLLSDSLERSYTVHVPEEIGSKPVPLVVFFHGKGGSSDWAEEETGWSEKADREGFIVVYPEGTPPNRQKKAKFLSNPLGWNDSFHRDDSSRPDDVAFIDQMMKEILPKFPIDQKRIYSVGFSNGAGMIFRIAVELPQYWTALAPVAGYCWQSEPQIPRPLPTIYLVGNSDPVIPIAGGKIQLYWGVEERMPVAETLQRWAKAMRCQENPEKEWFPGVQVERYRSSEPSEEFCVIYIDGLGHHWPGGKGGLGEMLGGPIIDRIHATDVIWEYFQNRRIELR
jgi:polyhydroxybutyrate depolymerase